MESSALGAGPFAKGNCKHLQIIHIRMHSRATNSRLQNLSALRISNDNDQESLRQNGWGPPPET
jgi:hypothetical protein